MAKGVGVKTSNNLKKKSSSTTIISTESGTPMMTINRPSATQFVIQHKKQIKTTPNTPQLPFQSSKNSALTPDFQKSMLVALLATKQFSVEQSMKIVKSYLKLNFSPMYYKRFGPNIIANHAKLFASAQFYQQMITNNTKSTVFVECTNQTMIGPNTAALYIVANNNQDKIKYVEAQISQVISQTPKENGYSIEMYTSNNKKQQYRVYWVHYDTYVVNENQGVAQLQHFNTDYIVCPVVAQRFTTLLTTSTPLEPHFDIYKGHDQDTTTVMVSFNSPDVKSTSTTHINQIFTTLLSSLQLNYIGQTVHTFSNNTIIMTVKINQKDADITTQLASLKQQFYNIINIPYSTTLTPALLSNIITPNEYIYISLITKILFYCVQSKDDTYQSLLTHFTTENKTRELGQLRNTYLMLRREAITHQRLESTFLEFLPIAQQLTNDFQQRQSIQQTTYGTNGPSNDTLLTTIQKTIPTTINTIDQSIMLLSLQLNSSILKSNIYTPHAKQAIAVRINGDFFNCMDLPRVPFGVFFVLGSMFQGLHVRFADVSRGGIRLIISRDDMTYKKSLQTQFQESFNLAFTQNLKNKDIPEFGSKGTVLLHPSAPSTQGIPSFERYINSLLDLITPQTENNITMVNNYGDSELLFLGPDEGTAGVMKWAALRAKERGYRYPLAFTTGKPASLGGIPHDVYGMTTNSVHRYVVGALQKLGLNEEEVKKCQTAGPDGDLGSNEIKISKDKTIAIIDGSGVLYDPEGINRDELIMLATKRIMCNNFDKTKLSSNGFFISVDDKNITLPDGEIVTNGFDFRNNFHLHDKFTSDLFVPCGGRPEAINLSNVNKLFNKDGQPKFKIIIEGANLFISQDARIQLEEAGVILYKDASTNKGGVTSSSLEVLASLAVPHDIFEKSLAVHDPANKPASYEKYAIEIRNRIIRDADLEFECIWAEHQRTKLPRCILTDKVSNKINELNDTIHASTLFDDKQVRLCVLKELLPITLQELVGFDTLLATAPESYLKASFTAYLASRFVYLNGLETTQEQFDAYITTHYRK